jgi:26S proteasome non-ATPase regulatory subunit 9
MSNLHAATIPSGLTSVGGANSDISKLSFGELNRKKDDLEAELKALGGVLDSHRVDMNTSLVTRDGFPRADIDVAQIRTTRSRIIYLRNDYKDLMATIEKRLHEHFASLPDEPTTNGAMNGTNGDARPAGMPHDFVPARIDPPFAKVDSIVNDSPAASAGLQVGDEIRNFGYVNKENHNGLRRVAECVQGNEGQNILVKICRRDGSGGAEELRLTLTPRRDWGGRGLLGCHILPL